MSDPTQICLGHYTYAYTKSTHNHTHVYTRTHIQVHSHTHNHPYRASQYTPINSVTAMCNILTWPAGVNTVDPVDRYIDKNGVITGMSPYPQVLCIGGCWDSCIRLGIISTKWLSKYHLDPWTWLNSVMVADASAHRRGLGQVANGEQTTKPLGSNEGRRGLP